MTARPSVATSTGASNVGATPAASGTTAWCSSGLPSVSTASGIEKPSGTDARISSWIVAPAATFGAEPNRAPIRCPFQSMPTALLTWIASSDWSAVPSFV